MIWLRLVVCKTWFYFCLNKRNAVQDQVDIKNLIVIDLTVTPAQVPCQVTVKDTMKRFSTIPLVGCYCPMS